MKKSDLISGKHIVELRDGSRLLVAGDFLPDIDGNGFMCLKSYSDDLKLDDCEVDFDERHTAFDMLKVYEIVRHKSLPRLADNMDSSCKLIWERKPELSDAERIILENADKKYKYIARDLQGRLYLYVEKPIKRDDIWIRTQKEQSLFTFESIFKMVKWEDKEPTLISDLLCEAEPFCWPK